MLILSTRFTISISLIDITLLMKLFKWVYHSTIVNSITQVWLLRIKCVCLTGVSSTYERLTDAGDGC